MEQVSDDQFLEGQQMPSASQPQMPPSSDPRIQIIAEPKKSKWKIWLIVFLTLVIVAGTVYYFFLR